MTSVISKYGVFSQFNKIKATTADGALQEIDADFEVKKIPQFFRLLDGTTEIQNPEQYVNIRVDNETYLGSVGEIYRPVDYKKMLAFTQTMVDENEASYKFGKTIGGGRQVYIIMRTADYLSLGAGDDIRCYFYVASSHDGSIAIDVAPTFIRENNGTILTMPETRGMKFKHTTKVEDKLAQARQTIGKIKSYWEESETAFRLMANTKITVAQAETYFKEIVSGDKTRSENIRDKYLSIFVGGPNQMHPATNGTMLGAYFSVVQHTDQMGVVRRTSKMGDKEYKDAKILSTIRGNGAERKAKAYTMALQIQKKFAK
jgi:phage/plasmid-like protein (TIGR03299 family)